MKHYSGFPLAIFTATVFAGSFILYTNAASGHSQELIFVQVRIPLSENFGGTETPYIINTLGDKSYQLSIFLPGTQNTGRGLD